MADRVQWAVVGVISLYGMTHADFVLLINSTEPGVLFLVFCWCIHKVDFNACFAVRLWDSIYQKLFSLEGY